MDTLQCLNAAATPPSEHQPLMNAIVIHLHLKYMKLFTYVCLCVCVHIHN